MTHGHLSKGGYFRPWDPWVSYPFTCFWKFYWSRFTFWLTYCFSLNYFKTGWRSLSLSVKLFTFSKKSNNPRILHVKEFISFLRQWHLTEQISPEIQQMWWVGKGSCRGVPPGKSYWEQEAAVKTLKSSTRGELLAESEEKGPKTNVCPFSCFYFDNSICSSCHDLLW